MGREKRREHTKDEKDAEDKGKREEKKKGWDNEWDGKLSRTNCVSELERRRGRQVIRRIRHSLGKISPQCDVSNCPDVIISHEGCNRSRNTVIIRSSNTTPSFVRHCTTTTQRRSPLDLALRDSSNIMSSSFRFAANSRDTCCLLSETNWIGQQQATDFSVAQRSRVRWCSCNIKLNDTMEFEYVTDTDDFNCPTENNSFLCRYSNMLKRLQLSHS